MSSFGKKVRLRYDEALSADDIDNNLSTSNSFESDESGEYSSCNSSSSGQSESDSSKEARPRRTFGWNRKKARDFTDDNATIFSTYSIQSSLSRVSESVQSVMERLDHTFDTFVDSMIAGESDSESDTSGERGPSFVKKLKNKIMTPKEVHMKMTTLTPVPKYKKDPGVKSPNFQFAKNRSFNFKKSGREEPSSKGSTKLSSPQLSAYHTPKSSRSLSSVRSGKHVPFSTRSTNTRRLFSTRSSSRLRPSSTKSTSLGRTIILPSSTKSNQKPAEKVFTFEETNFNPEPMQDVADNGTNFFSKGFNAGFFGFQDTEKADEISAEDPFNDLDSLATPPENQRAFWNEIMSFMHHDQVPSEIAFEGNVPDGNKKCFSFQRAKKNKTRKKLSYTSLS